MRKKFRILRESVINDYTIRTSISSSEKAEINHEVRKHNNKENEGLFDNVQTKTVIPTTAPTTLEVRLYYQCFTCYRGSKTRSFWWVKNLELRVQLYKWSLLRVRQIRITFTFLLKLSNIRVTVTINRVTFPKTLNDVTHFGFTNVLLLGSEKGVKSIIRTKNKFLYICSLTLPFVLYKIWRFSQNMC